MIKSELLRGIDKAIDSGRNVMIIADKGGIMTTIQVQYEDLAKMRDNIYYKFTKHLERIELGYKIINYKLT